MILKKASVTQPFRQDESGTVPSIGNEGVNAPQPHCWETQSPTTKRYAECEGTQSKATEPSLGAGTSFPVEVTPQLKLEGCVEVDQTPKGKKSVLCRRTVVHRCQEERGAASMS